jgi:autotransporter-associated beta strand protein
MRTINFARAFCLLVGLFAFTQQSRATVFTWAGGGGLNWNDPLNWDTNPTIPNSNTATDIIFNTTTNIGVLNSSTLTQNIGNPMIINSISFGTSAGSVVSGIGTFSLDNGIVITQSSSSDQFLNHGFRSSVNFSSNTLTLTGTGTGIVTISGPITEGGTLAGLAVSKTGSSTFRLTGTNTNISGYTLSGGALQANNGVGLPTSSGLLLRGGVLQSDGSGSVLFNRSLNVLTFNWGAGGGGFSAGGGGTMTIRIGNNTNSSTWASTTSFLGNNQPLILNSTSATGLVDWQNGINLGSSTAAQRTILVNDNPNLTTDFARISGVISTTTAGNSLLKSGSGRLELSALNTYTGLTQVGGGTLAVLSTGSLSGSVRVDTGAMFDVTDLNAGGGYTFAGARTISGNGSVTGKLNINTTGVISPGSSVGTIATESQDWGAGGVYNWELNDATGAAGSGFDQTAMAGSLTISSSAGSEFKIKIVSLSGAAPGNADNFDPDQNYSWIIATTTDGISPSFDATAFTIDRIAFANDTSNSLGTGFFLTADGNNLVLNYDGVPEPASATILGAALVAHLTRRPRRRQLN